MARPLLCALLAAGLSSAALAPRAVQATWSMVAGDPDTREVGAVGATCGPCVWMIGRVEPGAGAMVSLCGTNLGVRKDVTRTLADGGTPEEALSEVTAATYDDELGIRQYAIVGFEGPGAVYTGDERGVGARREVRQRQAPLLALLGGWEPPGVGGAAGVAGVGGAGPAPADQLGRSAR